MTFSIEQIMQPASLGPDFSWSFGGGLFQVCDHAEGETICLSEKEVIETIAMAVAGDAPVCHLDLSLAANVFANRNDEGLAAFIAQLFP